MKNILIALAIFVLISGGAHASIVDDFKNRTPDMSQPSPTQSNDLPVVFGKLPVICMKTEGIINNYIQKGYKKQVLGTTNAGTFELWTGVYEEKNRWSLVVIVENGLTCIIGGGEGNNTQ